MNKSFLLCLTLVMLIMFTSCSQSKSSGAQVGDTVLSDYTGMYENGTVFDTSIQKVAENNHIQQDKDFKPFQVTIGKRSTILGYEKSLVGMKVNDKKRVIIPPEAAYGLYNESAKDILPKEFFGESFSHIAVGQTIGLIGQDGTVHGATILSFNDTAAVVDLNHPLAGKTLIFDIEVKEIRHP
jgi:peptidylprolyl isomerase